MGDTSLGVERLTSVPDSFCYPIIKYRYEHGIGVVEVLYKNSDYDREFDCDPTNGCEPPRFEVDRQQESETSNSPFHIDEYSSDGGAINMNGKSPEINHHLLRLDTGNRENVYECTRIKTAPKTYVDTYINLTQIHRRDRFVNILQRILRHNLRNDLNVIAGYADVISSAESATPTIRQHANKISERCSDLHSISQNTDVINDVMKNIDDLVKVNIVTTVSDVIGEYNNQYDHIQLNYSVNTSQHHILATPHLHTLVDNLVENAIEHNTGEISVRVSIEEDSSAESVIFSVADNGVGMPETEIEVITGQRPISDLFHGSSLGLWVVRWIADQYGASIRFFESEMGGSEVVIEFPAF